MATLEEVLAGLDQQAVDSMSRNDTELLTNLVAQDMTRGLGLSPQGVPGFSGPVAGYAGPLRPSDVPSNVAGADIPVYYGSRISPGTIQARAEAGGPFRGFMPQPQAESLARGLSGLQGMGLPPGADKEIVEGILGRFGLSDKKSTMPNELLRSAGTDKFGDVMERELAKGTVTPEKQMQVERLHHQKWQASMVADPDRRVITGARTAADSLRKVRDAYEATPAFKTGKMSDTFKTALALTTSGAAAEQLVPFMTKLTPEERRYVAAANVFNLNLRGVSQDSRFSNFDSGKVLQAVGNPIVGKELYHDQVNSALAELEARHDNIIEDLTKQGKRTDQFQKFNEPKAETSSAAAGKVLEEGVENGRKFRIISDGRGGQKKQYWKE